MLRIRRNKFSQKVGLPPGSLVYTGVEKADPVEIHLIDYDATQLHEQDVQTIEECFPFKETSTVTWININGIHQTSIIESIGRHFGVHSLILEDLMSTGHRPKVQDYESYIFIVLRMIHHNAEKTEIVDEQISLIIGDNFVISFQEKNGDVFNPVRERIRQGKGRIRRVGPDYLGYALIDVIVDNYFTVLESLGEEIDSVEDYLMTDPTASTIEHIHRLKKETAFLRKSIWPLREIITGLQRGESPLFQENTLVFLRDVYDHIIEVVETIESLRDTVSGLLDMYISMTSFRMNEVMKVLTIVSTIFIPLTFIAGIYGMNFKLMPELEAHWGYPVVMVIMIVMAISMLIYFRRKHWL